MKRAGILPSSFCYDTGRMSTPLHFLTSSTFKIETAKLFLEPAGFEIVPLSLHIPEIQAETNSEIARVAAIEAVRLTGQPVMREDHGFFLNAVPRFPGVYMAHVESTVPPEMLLRMLEGCDHTGYFEMALAYVTPAGDVWEAVSRLPAYIGTQRKTGNERYGWDSIIGLEGDDRMLCEYPQKELWEKSGENFVQLLNHLQKV